MPITALPTPPNRSMTDAAFSAAGDAFMGALPTFAVQANVLQTEVNTAATSASASSQSAAISAAANGAINWVSATAYAVNNIRVSQNDFQLYRCKANTSGTIDPSADTANWVPIIRITQPKIAIPGNEINLATGAGFFTKTIVNNTTFTISGQPATGVGTSFILDLTNGGAFTIAWWFGLKWTMGVAPTLSSSGRDVIGFMTHDGGSTWTGMLLAKAAG